MKVVLAREVTLTGDNHCSRKKVGKLMTKEAPLLLAVQVLTVPQVLQVAVVQ